MVGGEEAAGGGVDLARYVRAQFSVIIREEVSDPRRKQFGVILIMFTRESMSG